MVDIRTVDEMELKAFRDLHNAYVDRNETIGTLRDWYREQAELFVGAFANGELIGHCLGRPQSEERVELAGIAVAPAHRRRGIGTALLSAFEDRAAALGFQQIGLGSAGGYVDKFYVENGYSPECVLVRLAPETDPSNYRNTDYEISEERIEDGTKKLYVEAAEVDPTAIEEIRAAFGDSEAVHVMTKELARSE